MPWVRSGECCKCGDCCAGDPFTGSAQGFCPLSAPQADGTRICTGRAHPYYLAGCVDWPSTPEQIADKPRCSYTFAWVD